MYSPVLPPTPMMGVPVKAVLYTRFEDVEGYVVTASDPPNVMKDQFKDIGYHFLPDSGICWRLISLVLGDFRMIGVPVHIDDSRYARRAFVFCFCIVVVNKPDSVLLAKAAAQELAESFHALENKSQFLSNDEEPIEEFLLAFRRALNDKTCEYVNVHLTGNSFVQFSKNLSIEVPDSKIQIEPYFTPIALTSLRGSEEWIKLSAVAEILDACNGKNSVSEISNLLEIDFRELSFVLTSLVKRNLLVLVDQPIDTYTRVRLTPKFHTFFDDLNNRQEAVSYCQMPSTESLPVESGSVANLGNYLVRMYCRIDGHVSDLGEFKTTDQCLVNVRHLVLFGLLKGFLRCKTMYPLYTDNVTTMVPVLRLCDGTNSWDHIGAQFQLTRLEVNEIFNHHGVLKIWK